MLFPTGFAANVGTIAALAGKGDVVFSDVLNHASLIDEACRLSGAKIVVYPHRDLTALAEALRQMALPGNW
ncbi:MAG: aminotransferase class I/II-fold pyridoxal phosphate-dependent enzyme [Planctomycetales bacterium]